MVEALELLALVVCAWLASKLLRYWRSSRAVCAWPVGRGEKMPPDTEKATAAQDARRALAEAAKEMEEELEAARPEREKTRPRRDES